MEAAATPPSGRDQGGAFWQLALANWRSLIRDTRTFVVVLLFPFAFIALYLLIDSVTSKGPYTVAVVTDDPTARTTVEQALRSSGHLKVVDPPEAASGLQEDALGSLDAIVKLRPEAGRAEVTTGGVAAPVSAVRDAFRDAGLSYPVAGRTSTGDVPLEPLRFGLPAVLLLAFTSLVLFGTALPIISLRERGVLRLLGMTPLARSTFLLAQAPARLMIAGLQLGAMCTLAAVTGFLDLGAIASLLLTSVFGLAMLFSLGYLVAGVLRSAELATTVMGTLLPFALFLSGVFIPLRILPGGLQAVAPYVPLSYLGDALRQDLVGLPGEYSKLLSYSVMLGVSVVLTAVATATFRWDQGE